MGALLDYATTAPASYGLLLLQAVVALVLVSGLAFVVLRFAARRGIGVSRGRTIQVEERTPIDMKNAVVVVRVGARRLLLATHDHGPARLLMELEGEPMREPEERNGP